MAAVKTSTVKGRLRGFEFSETQPYILEFCDQAMRFFRNHGQITANDITAAT